ncbi:MAG TPA: hypothetical protein VK625_21515, partial [Flavitalea sp.]|nr:hypothetical protein [Flavitalea sp.]
KDREQQKQSSPGNDNFLRSVYNCIQALIDIRQKSHNMKLVQIAKKKGALVICDRYPQNEIMGYSDGPVLHDLLSSKNIIFRTVARIESNTYTHSLNHSPDILFKLVDDHPEKRRPEETVLVDNDPELAAGIEQLSFNNKCKVILVDAAKPLNEVLYTIKKEIWNIL